MTLVLYLSFTHILLLLGQCVITHAGSPLCSQPRTNIKLCITQMKNCPSMNGGHNRALLLSSVPVSVCRSLMAPLSLSRAQESESTQVRRVWLRIARNFCHPTFICGRSKGALEVVTNAKQSPQKSLAFCRAANDCDWGGTFMQIAWMVVISNGMGKLTIQLFF